MSYVDEWGGVVAFVCLPVILVTPVLGPMLALIVLAVVLMAAAAALVAAAGAIAATPFLLTRAARRHWHGEHTHLAHVSRATVGRTP